MASVNLNNLTTAVSSGSNVHGYTPVRPFLYLRWKSSESSFISLFFKSFCTGKTADLMLPQTLVNSISFNPDPDLELLYLKPAAFQIICTICSSGPLILSLSGGLGHRCRHCQYRRCLLYPEQAEEVITSCWNAHFLSHAHSLQANTFSVGFCSAWMTF